MGITFCRVRIRNPIEGTSPEELEAKVDTGSVMLVIPRSLAERHRFPKIRKQRMSYADGRTTEKDVVGGVEVEILGRKGWFDAIVEEGRENVLIGAIILEELDLIVEPRSRKVFPNPRSKDMPMSEIE